jgi:acetate kinase
MKILIINAGSSSLRFQLFESETEQLLLRGLYDGLGGSLSRGMCHRTINAGRTAATSDMAISNHNEALADMLGEITAATHPGIMDEIAAVGHRVVHGGENFIDTALVDRALLDGLKNIAHLAPLHNPVNIACIEFLMEHMPPVRHYAVFDTAYHHTMRREVYLYGLPLHLYHTYGIRKYGFHGSNHKYVAHKTAEILGRNIHSLKSISCHLGNGQSICAIKDGISVDTSMGFTPLEGLPMGTRSGSFDPGITLFLIERGFTSGGLKKMFNNESGLLGVSGISSDYRTIADRMKAGDENALLVHAMMVHRITCVIGSYAAEMSGVDAISFTGGIGENAGILRRDVLENLSFLGLHIDAAANMSNGTLISAPGSRVSVLVIPANEELQIVRDVKDAMQEVSS